MLTPYKYSVSTVLYQCCKVLANRLKNKEVAMANLEEWNKVHEVKNKHCSTLLRNPHVNYVGVSFKETAGKPTDTPTIRVAVKRKLPLTKLSDEEKIPPLLDDIPTDVIEGDLNLVKLGDILNQDLKAEKPESAEQSLAAVKVSLTGDVDPFTYSATITSCMSIARYKTPMTNGTVGCFVTVTGDPKLPGITIGKNYLVTCQHVVEGASPSDRIIIPATKKSGIPSNYDRSSYTNGRDSLTPDNFDVAAIELDAGVAFKNEVPTATSKTSFTGVLAGWPNPSIPVFKYGATTWYKDGTVIATNVSSGEYDGIMTINGKKSGSRATLIADSGDSGSVFVISGTSQITGQLFAVNNTTKVSGGYTQAYAYPMDRQLSALAGSWKLT